MSETIQNSNRGRMQAKRRHAFDVVKEPGCSLPNVEATVRYDGSPVLKVKGAFLADMAMHAPAEAGMLVVRAEFEEREAIMA